MNFTKIIINLLKYVLLTCTPKIPNIIKKVQQINTMFPIGLKEDNNVCTTSFKPGALLITLNGRRDLSNRKTLSIPNILEVVSVMRNIIISTRDIITNAPSIIFHPEVKYALEP